MQSINAPSIRDVYQALVPAWLRVLITMIGALCAIGFLWGAWTMIPADTPRLIRNYQVGQLWLKRRHYIDYGLVILGILPSIGYLALLVMRVAGHTRAGRVRSMILISFWLLVLVTSAYQVGRSLAPGPPPQEVRRGLQGGRLMRVQAYNPIALRAGAWFNEKYTTRLNRTHVM